jgi:sensor c-di-GMP phosphodiesterase-like protein
MERRDDEDSNAKGLVRDRPRLTRMTDLTDIQRGLVHGEFFLEYLPIISLTGGQCIGAEALVRWRHAATVLQPSEFIPSIENTPVSGLLSYWVIDTVATELGDWLRANRDALISFNVPPEILGRGGLEYVAAKSGLIDRPSQVMLEITERGIPDLLGVEAISYGQRRGLKIALDDVTLVGGANLAVLARCDLFAIKLDKSLIDKIGRHCPAPEWLTAVTALLESSRLQVIAEGVETEQQAMTLRAAHVQAAQGFYFSRPIPAAAFMEFYRGRGISGGSTASSAATNPPQRC